MWDLPPGITPSSRCWETSLSAITSRKEPSPWPGSSSWTSSACPPTSSGPPFTRGRRAWGSDPTKKPGRSGKNTSRRSASGPFPARTTSGKWGIRAPAALAPRSSSTKVLEWDAVAASAPWGANATGIWNCGTWFSCNSNALPMGPSSPSPSQVSTPAWDWSGSPPSFKGYEATTTRTSLPEF